MTIDVVVCGSANLDVVISVREIPAPGETVLATGRRHGQGGKGANQAIAAARCGARTAFLGALGDDDAGSSLRGELRDAGVDVESTRSSPLPTGTAYVLVDVRGENVVVVDPGANGGWGPLVEPERALITGAHLLLCQLEVPLETVAEALRTARMAGVRTVLNAAPAVALAGTLLEHVDVLVVNELEARALAGESTLETAATVLQTMVPDVVVTMGAAGALVGQTRIPGVPARQVVDTTGAGDTFCGAFAAALAEGLELTDAARFGCAAASLSVESPGAGPSAPTREQVQQRLRG